MLPLLARKSLSFFILWRLLFLLWRIGTRITPPKRRYFVWKRWSYQDSINFQDSINVRRCWFVSKLVLIEKLHSLLIRVQWLRFAWTTALVHDFIQQYLYWSRMYTPTKTTSNQHYLLRWSLTKWFDIGLSVMRDNGNAVRTLNDESLSSNWIDIL